MDKMNGRKNYEGTQDETEDDKISLDEVVNQFGFGKFQFFIIIVCGILWLSDGMEIMLLTILGPILRCEWRLESWQEALISTSVFAGLILGSPLIGWFADVYGRKKGLVLSSSWVFYYGILCACAPTLWWFIFLRFTLGIGLGSLPVISTYGMEFLPTNVRARGVQAIHAMGASVATLLALVLIKPYGWRVWVLACATPCLIFLVLSIWAPESPRFYLVSGQHGKARKVMQTIANFNGCQLPPQKLYFKQQEYRGRVKDLFKPELRKLTILLLAIWFISLFLYYGAILLITETINVGSTCRENSSFKLELSTPEPMCSLECTGPDNKQLADIFFNSLAELPVTIAVAFFADWCGRKPAFMISFAVYTLVAILLCICMEGAIMLMILFTWRGFGLVVLQLTFLYTSEAYPTHVRSIGVGFLNCIGRVGGLLTPFIAQVLSRYSMSLTFIIYAAMSFIGGVCAFFLPIETKSRILA